MGFENVKNQYLAAYEDIDHDKYTDIITIDKNKRALNIYLYDNKNTGFTFKKSISTDKDIYSIQLFDFNYDG
jgi:hypothetical protein